MKTANLFLYNHRFIFNELSFMSTPRIHILNVDILCNQIVFDNRIIKRITLDK